jgi:putative ABC transport system ATP-binding protein
MIEIKDLHKSYKMGSSELHVLKGINFNIKEGELVAIMGSSGSGKSTLLNILGILDEADSGNYILDNVPIKKLNETIASRYYQGVKRKERYEIAMSYLEKVGLATHSHHLPSELSGGQKQRVAIARALASNPKVLLADEPTGALDTKTSYEVMELIQGINDEGKTILIVTHEPDIAAMCKRNVVLKDGLIIDDKMVEQVRASAYV